MSDVDTETHDLLIKFRLCDVLEAVAETLIGFESDEFNHRDTESTAASRQLRKVYTLILKAANTADHDALDLYNSPAEVDE